MVDPRVPRAESLACKIRLLSREISGFVSESLAPFGLTPSQAEFLYCLIGGSTAEIPMFAAFMRSLSFRAYTTYELMQDPAALAAARAYLADRFEDGRLRPTIARTFDLGEVADAHRFMESNEQIGKIVLRAGG
ncbi:MAG: zinc-binding dehydrogenase [Planctomycetota bacterium]